MERRPEVAPALDLRRLRNVGVFAHIDAGKTTLTERFLVTTGRERRAGRVDDGTTVMDWMPEERERGITITAAATRFQWGEIEVNLIDTPGHVDFTFEVERSLRALDGAILVLDAVAGVQAQTETIWRQLVRARVPIVAFVNKCDRPGADALAAAATLRTRLGAAPLPIAYPWHDEEGQLVGVLDVIAIRAWRYDAEGQAQAEDVPAALRDEVLVLRAEVVDALAARDERLLELVGAGQEAPASELVRALRTATLARELVPVVVGAALRGVGVLQVLDALVAYLPSPREAMRPQAFAAVTDDSAAELGARLELPQQEPDAPFVAFVFKVQTTRHRDLVFVRILAGRATPSMRVWNPRLGGHERIAEVLRLHANATESLNEACAGDIVAFSGLARSGTGDTLVVRDEHGLSFTGTLAPLTSLEPVVSLTVEPADGDERERLGLALARLVREDPSFRAVEDPASGQWTAHGMGELHLEVTLGRLAREFGLAPRTGRPRVTYREVLTARATGRGTVERAFHGREGFAEVEVRIGPVDEAGVGLGLVDARVPSFTTAAAAAAATAAGAGSSAPGRPPLAAVAVTFAADAAVPLPRRAAVAAALASEASSGPRFGLPLAPIEIEVFGGHGRREADLEAVWVQAAVAALRDALRHALQAGGLDVHEPHVRVVVDTPEAFSSSIIGDLQARHAVLGEVESGAGVRTVHARGPLAEFFGYTTVLRSLSQGRAVSMLAPAGYGAVPEHELAARGFSWL
jgi:elongation factor G